MDGLVGEEAGSADVSMAEAVMVDGAGPGRVAIDGFDGTDARGAPVVERKTARDRCAQGSCQICSVGVNHWVVEKNRNLRLDARL
eukprot:3797599-Prymnesium_polylepis.1